MNIVCIHIDEKLDDRDIKYIKQELAIVPHVVNVELNPAIPHDLAVEYEEHHNMPVTILDTLSKQGLHMDVQPC